MPKILAFPPEDPSGTNPTPSHASATPTLPPVRCAPWCVRADGHPDAVHVAEQRCTGVELRLDTVIGGGTGDDEAPTSTGTLVSRAQQLPGQAPTFLVGIQTLDAEAFVELNGAELTMFVEYARLLLKTTRQVEQLR